MDSCEIIHVKQVAQDPALGPRQNPDPSPSTEAEGAGIAATPAPHFTEGSEAQREVVWRRWPSKALDPGTTAYVFPSPAPPPPRLLGLVSEE